MLVTIRLFARLRELAGRAELASAICRTARPSRNAWDALVRECPALAAYGAVAVGRGQRRLRALHDAAARRRRGRVPAAGLGGIGAVHGSGLTGSGLRAATLADCRLGPSDDRLATRLTTTLDCRLPTRIMFDKLAAEETRYEQLMAEMADPSVQSDNARFREHSKALAEIQPLVEQFRRYKEVVERDRGDAGAARATPTCASWRRRR